MKVALDLDDFSVLNNRMDLLLKIKDHYPDFKVSLFTIPFDYKVELNPQATILRKNSLKLIHENLDWLQIIPHGLTHMEEEMLNVSYYDFRDTVMPAIDEALKKDELPYVKGFKPPYWLYNKDVVRALDEKGWFTATDRNQPTMVKGKINYQYTHDLAEPFYESTNDVIKLHGHIDGVSKNDLEVCFINIFKLKNPEWHFVTDFLEEVDKSEL